jgi:hypothetical protein
MSRRAALPVIRMIALAVAIACLAAPAAARARASSVRVWRENVAAPAQFDFSLTEVRFVAGAHAGNAHARFSRSIRLAMAGPTGLDYVAGAITSFGVRTRPRVLVLVVNRRPRGSLAPDLARISVAITAARRLGKPAVFDVGDAFTRPRSGGGVPALCDLPVGSGSLAAASLRSLLRRGAALEGFSAQMAIAQAYNAVCGKPYDPAFRRAVTKGSVLTCQAPAMQSLPCCPPNAMCAPPPCATCPCPACGCPACSCGCPCPACSCSCACGAVPCAAAAQSGSAPARSSIACPLQAGAIVCPL